MMCACVSQERSGSPRFGERGLKSGPAQTGASEADLVEGAFLAGALLIFESSCGVPRNFIVPTAVRIKFGAGVYLQFHQSALWIAVALTELDMTREAIHD